MRKLDAEKAAKVGDLLFRYMRARHRFKSALVEPPLPAHELAQLIAGGKCEFDAVYMELDANPPIAFDGKADDVFEALIKKKNRAIPFGTRSSWPRGVITSLVTGRCRGGQLIR